MHKRALNKAAQALQRDIADTEGMVLADELEHRRRVLRRLGFVESSGLVTKKGHVRCLPLLV